MSTTTTLKKRKSESSPASTTDATHQPRKKKTDTTTTSSHSNRSSPLLPSSSATCSTTASDDNNSTTQTNHHQDHHEVFQPYTLPQIRDKIVSLCKRVPLVPAEGIDPDDKEAVRNWATQMQTIIEEFNLLLCCVSSATYKWGTDRSGAADQNLALLSNELGNAQDQISTSVSPRLSNVLAPVVDLVTKESITTKDENGVERKVNYFGQEENDPMFIQLCTDILCRNAVMLRHVLLTNFHKVRKCIDDYLKATKKDGEGQRASFVY